MTVTRLSTNKYKQGAQYTMQNSNNKSQNTKNEYINYLYQECTRKICNPNPKIYDEIIYFLETPEGQKGFEQFKTICPNKIGLITSIPKNPIKRHLS